MPEIKNTDTKKSDSQKARPLVYFFVGLSVTVFNYLLYILIARFVIKNSDLLWLSNLIANIFATILAYILHSRITWKDRKVTKSNILRFFIWNAILTFLINPFFTWLFGLATFVYDFAFTISTNLNFPFDYDFIQSTGAFGFTGVVVMIMNYFCYDRFVFEVKKNPRKNLDRKDTQQEKNIENDK